jgi:hypothetical protein
VGGFQNLYRAFNPPDRSRQMAPNFSESLKKFQFLLLSKFTLNLLLHRTCSRTFQQELAHQVVINTSTATPKQPLLQHLNTTYQANTVVDLA